jgi:hypothetical protein
MTPKRIVNLDLIMIWVVLAFIFGVMIFGTGRLQ